MGYLLLRLVNPPLVWPASAPWFPLSKCGCTRLSCVCYFYFYITVCYLDEFILIVFSMITCTFSRGLEQLCVGINSIFLEETTNLMRFYFNNFSCNTLKIISFADTSWLRQWYTSTVYNVYVGLFSPSINGFGSISDCSYWQNMKTPEGQMLRYLNLILLFLNYSACRKWFLARIADENFET
jgi:hypothetical protein